MAAFSKEPKPGSARTRPPPFRKYIPYIEYAAAKAYGTALRRCKEQNVRYGEKINPLTAIKRESEFIARYRLPRALVKKIARDFGESVFWEKVNDPKAETCKKFVNAEWVVSTMIYVKLDLIFACPYLRLSTFCPSYVTRVFANLQTCLGLRYLATGAPLQLLTDIQGRCCKATVSNNINRFICYLAAMCGTNVRFPTVC